MSSTPWWVVGAALAAAVGLGMLLPGLWRRWRHRARQYPRVAPGPPAPVPGVGPEVSHFHVYWEPGDGTTRLLYHGSRAAQAKDAYYDRDKRGVFTFYDGAVPRGRREV